MNSHDRRAAGRALPDAGRIRDVRGAAPFAERADFHIAIIENNALIRGSFAKAVLGSLPCSVREYPSIADYLEEEEAQDQTVVIVSFAGRPNDSMQQDLEQIAAAKPESRAVVFAQAEGPEAALSAVGHGAKGYVPLTLGWELAVAAIRVVAAGGTYIPAEFLVVQHSSAPAVQEAVPPNGFTVREMDVLRAIQQGKPNKLIAHDLNVRESTVKAHVRHIMVKMRAKNRTELAVRWSEPLRPGPSASRE